MLRALVHSNADPRVAVPKTLTNQAEEAWEPVSKDTWYTLKSQPDPEGFHVDIHRMNALVEIPPYAVVALLGLPDLRPKWDDFCQSCETAWDSGGIDDIIMRIQIKPPIVSPREALLRRIIARDFPEPGCLCVVGADGADGVAPTAGCVRASLRLLNAVARPVPGCPEKANLTVYAQLDMGLPQFMANFAVRNMIPRLVGKLQAGYTMLQDDPLIGTFR